MGYYPCMHRLLPVLIAVVFTLYSCKGQFTKSVNDPSGPVGSSFVGVGCDGCELMFIDMPPVFHSIDTSPGWKEKGQSLVIHGQAFKRDGKTPAPGIIIYYWHTDNNGYYSPVAGMDPQTKRHGYIRGWIKTDESGRYTLYTIRPAPYPKEDMPAHVHLSVREPHISNEYYVDELVFDNDKLLTTEKRAKLENRGGSGILKVESVNGRQEAKHTLVAGLNIPGYPQ